jgi:hypothetical protein
MKRTLFSLFRNSCATAFTPVVVLSSVSSALAQTAVETNPIPPLGQAAELRPQVSTKPRLQESKVSRSFSFSSLPSGLLDQVETIHSQASPSTSPSISTDSTETSSSRSSFQSLALVRSNSTLLAQNSSEASATTSTLEIPEYIQNQKSHRLFIGPEIFYRNYNEEEIVPQFKSFEFGFLYGVKLQYDYVKRNAIYFGGDFRYDRGQTTYSGGLQDQFGNFVAPYNSTTDNEFVNLEGRLGYTFKADKVGRLLMTPFIGYGYQRWSRDISGDGEIPGFGPFPISDLSEDYSWQYLAGGLRTEYRPSKSFTVGLNLKVLGMVNGKINVSGPGFEEKLDLGEKIQLEVEFPLTYHIVDKPKSSIDVRFTPFYRSQNIGRGNPGLTALEPASTTDVYGATFGVVFGF